MGIASAESGIKQCVSKLVPDARWLVETIQSPPIHKIIGDYIPNELNTLAKNTFEGKILIPKVIKTELNDGVWVRNALSHTGNFPKPKDKGEQKKLQPYLDDITRKTEELLSNIRDLLYLIDYYCEHEWALDYVREETLESMGIDGRGKQKNPAITKPGPLKLSLQVSTQL